MTENNDYCVRSWNATYYVTSIQKWINGMFCLSPNSLQFKSNDLVAHHNNARPDGNPFILYLNFSQISNISKVMSSYIFPAIKVTQMNGELHWFSSIQDRNEAFLLINHFFQMKASQNLISTSSTHVSTAPFSQHKTKIGTDLLQSVHDSQATLQKGAVSLVEQGNQLRNAALVMEEIHQDLTVAERITKGINSWFGRWKLPPTVKAEELIVVKDNDIPDVWDIEVLCAKIIYSQHENKNINVLRISRDGLSIIDMKQKILQHFKWPEITVIKVVSPWEIFVTKSYFGQPDLSYQIISSSLPRVLPRLDVFMGRKIEYMNPPDIRQTQHLEPSWAKPVSELQSQSKLTAPTKSSTNDHEQLLVAEQKNQVSDAEFSELTSTLANLKSLALDIQVEQNDQLSTLEQLEHSVTKANDRIKCVNKIIQKNNT